MKRVSQLNRLLVFDEVKKCRFCKNPACKSCPIYDLDGDTANE